MESDQYAIIRDRVIPKDGRWMDPVALFRKKLPLDSETMKALLVKSGQLIGKRQLRTGDLVFFKVPSKGRHVGICLGRAEFAHASTQKGVTISSLKDRYWRRAYWTARRFLNTPQ